MVVGGELRYGGVWRLVEEKGIWSFKWFVHQNKLLSCVAVFIYHTTVRRYVSHMHVWKRILNTAVLQYSSTPALLQYVFTSTVVPGPRSDSTCTGVPGTEYSSTPE